MTPYLDEYAAEFDALRARSDWDSLSKEIFEIHQEVIEANLELELASWKEENYFLSGVFAGHNEAIFLNNAPEEDDLTNDLGLTTALFMNPF